MLEKNRSGGGKNRSGGQIGLNKMVDDENLTYFIITRKMPMRCNGIEKKLTIEKVDAIRIFPKGDLPL
jgi:hypothetical protein